MNIRMNHNTVDTINAVLWATVTGFVYALPQFDTIAVIVDLFLLVGKTSLVGFVAGLSGYIAKSLGELIITKIKERFK
jgi:hypothetical protein